MLTKWLRVIGILLLLFFFFVSTWSALKWITISQLFSYFVNTLANLTGFSLYLIKAAVILLLIPLFYGLKWTFLPFTGRRKRLIGSAMLTSLAVGYNVGLYFATRQVSFSGKGEALRYYALTPEGVKYSDRPGVEPVYGVPFRAVTPEVARNLRLLEKGEFKPVDPATVAWFNPITGQAQLWHYRYPDGQLEFYDKPGYHPFTNEPLKEVTRELYLEWREKTKVPDFPGRTITRATGSPEAGASMGQRVPRAPEAPAAATPQTAPARQARLEEFKALIHRGVGGVPGKTTIAMAMDAAPVGGGLSPDSAFYRGLRSDKAIFVSILARMDLLKGKGFFEELYQGDQELLRTAASISGADYLILGRLTSGFRRGASVDASLISCDLHLSCRVANRTGTVVLDDSLSAVGAGFTEAAAVENAGRVLSANFLERVVGRLP